MLINIRGEKFKLTPAIKEHIEQKLSKLNPYFDNHEEISASVVLRLRGIEQIIEVTIPVTKITLRAQEEHKDLYAATDLVVDKLERLIRKNKTRIKKSKHHPSIALNFDFEDGASEELTKIVKRKEIESKPMDEEEAILQMELLNHDFFVFKNIDEDCTSVVYLRKDGHYGLLNMR